MSDRSTAMASPEALQRASFLTSNYKHLQGLKLLPLAFFMAVWVVYPPISGRGASAPAAWTGWLVLLAAVVAVAAWRIIDRYYRRAFGVVAPRSRFPLGLVSAWVAVSSAGVLDERIGLPVSLFGLVGASLVAAYYWSRRRFQPHYLVLAGVLALASALPLEVWWPVDGGHPVDTDPGIFIVLIVFWVVGGILDHRVLMRELGGQEA